MAIDGAPNRRMETPFIDGRMCMKQAVESHLARAAGDGILDPFLEGVYYKNNHIYRVLGCACRVGCELSGEAGDGPRSLTTREDHKDYSDCAVLL